MQFKKSQGKKLKTLNSLETEVTQLEHNQSSLKNSLKSSKQKNNHASQKKTVEYANQIVMLSISQQIGNSWLKVPQMSNKHKESTLFNTHHFQILQSSNQERMKMVIRKSRITQENASRDMNQASLLMLLNQDSKSQNYKYQGQGSTVVPTICTKLRKYREGNQKQRDCPQKCFDLPQSKYLKRINSDVSKCQLRQEQLRVEQSSYPKMSNKDSDQLEANVDFGNQSLSKRLKLRDYMLKNQISRAKALEQKKKERQAESAVHSPRNNFKKITGSKNRITNQQLCRTLKKQILNDLDQSLSSISQIKDIIVESQFAIAQPTNQYLFSIFRMRDLVKNEITKQLKDLSAKLAKSDAVQKQQIFEMRKIERFC